MKIDGLETESLQSRLDAMVREHALTRWIGAALFAGVVAFLTWNGLPSRSTVRTERLELRDRQGRPRAELGLDPEHGIPHLIMNDAEGRSRFSLIALDSGPVAVLSGPGGSRMVLDATRLEVPALDVRAPEGRDVVSIVAGENGSLTLTIQSGGRQSRWNARPGEQGRPVLTEATVGGPVPTDPGPILGWSPERRP